MSGKHGGAYSGGHVARAILVGHGADGCGDNGACLPRHHRSEQPYHRRDACRDQLHDPQSSSLSWPREINALISPTESVNQIASTITFLVVTGELRGVQHAAQPHQPAGAFGAHLFNDRTRGATNLRCSNCHEQNDLTDASVRRIAAATVNDPVRNRDGNIAPFA